MELRFLCSCFHVPHVLPEDLDLSLKSVMYQELQLKFPVRYILEFLLQTRAQQLGTSSNIYVISVFMLQECPGELYLNVGGSVSFTCLYFCRIKNVS